MRQKSRRETKRKTKRRTQDQRSAETRQKLIDAAIGAICELGLSAATTTLIAERAGLSRGALQHHFETRIDLLAAVIDCLSTTISSEMSLLTDALPSTDHPIERRIDAAIQAYWKIYSSRTFLAVLTIFLGVRNDPRHYGPLQQHMQAFYRMNDNLWLQLVRDSHLSTLQIIATRRILFSTLRGLLIGKLLGTQPDATHTEFQLLQKMLVTVLARKR